MAKLGLDLLHVIVAQLVVVVAIAGTLLREVVTGTGKIEGIGPKLGALGTIIAIAAYNHVHLGRGRPKHEFTAFDFAAVDGQVSIVFLSLLSRVVVLDTMKRGEEENNRTGKDWIECLPCWRLIVISS